MKDVADLTGRVAVVAGGGKGIGRSVAILLGRKHARIVLADVDADAGVDTVAAINGLGGEAAFFLADVSLSNQVQSLVEFAVEKYQRIDVLFSSVGVYARAKLTETDEALWVIAAIPGVQPDRVIVRLQDSYLTISGERPLPACCTEGELKIWEIPLGRFERQLGPFSDVYSLVTERTLLDDGLLIVELRKNL